MTITTVQKSSYASKCLQSCLPCIICIPEKLRNRKEMTATGCEMLVRNSLFLHW